MNRATRRIGSAVLIAGALALLAGCGPRGAAPGARTPEVKTPPAATPDVTPPVTAPPTTPAPKQEENPADQTVKVAADPAAVTALINKRIKLPADYRPSDLVEPNVRFIFAEKVEKRMLRKEAAHALEQLFAAAEKDSIYLAGVSGYRSYETQDALFKYYVQTQGEETARKYSAEPGHSEHQTGLAMDVSGSTGECAADDCFAGTPEAEWLAKHAHEFGFIIRYPKGKEAITGYNYEPWHLRYVGVTMAKEIAAKGLTLEEYYQQAR